MAKIEAFNTINSIMEKGDVPQEKRDYLGYSGIGGKCLRKVWYSFRWADDVHIPRRIERIFRRGDLEEQRVISDLSRVGCTVTDDQLEVVGTTGHARGHIDGIAIGVPTAEKTPHLFECKTMKADQFKRYLKSGLEKFSGAYWQQIHSYMGHLGLKRCLYVVVNKDTEERDYARIRFSPEQFEEGERIAFNVITSSSAPDKLANAKPTYFECRICGYNDICNKGKEHAVNCRTCKHWNIEEDGQFSCELTAEWLTREMQLAACDRYEFDEEAYK